MPYSQYVAGREPPSLADRILAHSQTMDGNVWSPTGHPAGWERQD